MKATSIHMRGHPGIKGPDARTLCQRYGNAVSKRDEHVTFYQGDDTFFATSDHGLVTCKLCLRNINRKKKNG